MKQLGFVSELIPLVLSGEKTITWRRQPYDFDILPGDVLEFVESVTRKPFARAKIVSVNNTTFGGMRHEDKEGHEKFVSEEEMYRTYSGYFGYSVTGSSLVKVIKFKLI
ncbi:MAG: PUA-like protein [archaeon GW2011_AR5]|nr:MAG: PUA-like protein [archaeon GW2011_AR5]